MSASRRLFLAFAIIGFGICASLPFRHQRVSSRTTTTPDGSLHDNAADWRLSLSKTHPKSLSKPKPQPTLKTKKPIEIRREANAAPDVPFLPEQFEPAQLPVVELVEHRIVDGDQLKDLATRYLGNPKRWREIQAVNPTTLSNPEILPIGAVIRIRISSKNPGAASESPSYHDG